MRTIILLGLLLLVSCGGGSVTPTPTYQIPLELTYSVLDCGLGSTMTASLEGNKVRVTCDANGVRTLHFWGTLLVYLADHSVGAIIPIDYIGDYSVEFYAAPDGASGVRINDWGMRATD